MYTKSVPFIAKKTEICGNCIYSAVFVVYLVQIFGQNTDFCFSSPMTQPAQCSPAFSTGPRLLNQNMAVIIRGLRVIFKEGTGKF
jgi:hypothetical protein